MIGKTLMPIGKQEGYCKPRTVFTNLSCTVMTGLFKIQIDRTNMFTCSFEMFTNAHSSFIHNS